MIFHKLFLSVQFCQYFTPQTLERENGFINVSVFDATLPHLDLRSFWLIYEILCLPPAADCKFAPISPNPTLHFFCFQSITVAKAILPQAAGGGEQFCNFVSSSFPLTPSIHFGARGSISFKFWAHLSSPTVIHQWGLTHGHPLRANNE